jgi:hypothetical protein
MEITLASTGDPRSRVSKNSATTLLAFMLDLCNEAIYIYGIYRMLAAGLQDIPTIRGCLELGEEMVCAREQCGGHRAIGLVVQW